MLGAVHVRFCADRLSYLSQFWPRRSFYRGENVPIVGVVLLWDAAYRGAVRAKLVSVWMSLPDRDALHVPELDDEKED